MGKIIAIGGGEIGRPGYPVETTSIDEEIIRLSGKDKPKLLFIPTATNDSETYINAIQKQFGKRFGCTIDILRLVTEKYRYWELQIKVGKADIIYIGGGNSLRMMKRWRRISMRRLGRQKQVVPRYGTEHTTDNRSFTYSVQIDRLRALCTELEHFITDDRSMWRPNETLE